MLIRPEILPEPVLRSLKSEFNLINKLLIANREDLNLEES